MPKLAPLLARHFTVINYDRRGRNESGDTAPYAVADPVPNAQRRTLQGQTHNVALKALAPNVEEFFTCN